jgi:ComF family protein
MARPLAEQLAYELGAVPDIERYTIVPIPMPAFRKLLRGYNQAELLAEHVGRKLGIPVEHELLIRTKSSVRQATSRTRHERFLRQKGSFGVSEKAPPEHILLIDDVITTGATIGEARNLLLKGSKNVIAGTVAH